jgi:hypothetical protein
MGEGGLKVAEICKIIEACRESGVTEFSYSGLNLKFHQPGPADVIKLSQAVSHIEVASEPVGLPDDPVASVMNEQAIEDAEEAQLLIDDAFAYERAQIMKDIERNRVRNA